MSVTVDESLIAEAGRRLARAAGAHSEVILFGSHARGEAGPHREVRGGVVHAALSQGRVLAG